MAQKINVLNVNKEIIDNFKKQFSNWSELQIVDNDLIYQNNSCNISKFNIYNLLHNDQFASAINILNAKDIFNIIRLHTIILSDNDINNFYSLISSNKELSNNDKNIVDKHYKLLNELYNYQDYLLPYLKKYLNNFINYSVLLDIKDGSLNENEKKTVDKYNEMTYVCEDKNLAKSDEAKLIKKIDQNGNTNISELILIIVSLASILTLFTLFLTK